MVPTDPAAKREDKVDTSTKTGDEGPSRAYRLRFEDPAAFAYLVDSVYWAGKAPHTGNNGRREARNGRCNLVKTSRGCWLRQDGKEKTLYQLPKLAETAGSGFYSHVIMAVLVTTKPPLPGDQASHLCNNKACCNPWHLVVESAAKNYMRRLCVGSGQCNRAHGGPDCLM